MTNEYNPHSSWEPIGDPHKAAGFAIPAPFQTHRRPTDQTNFDTLQKAAQKIQDDPLKVQQLADRVYALLLEDLREQKQRQGLYKGRLS
ncbi:hypothetical protein [Roseofilum sp. Guam]|uniref:hypothetical protein n=1 Tax=Roseofilum sp. Guam TaxID=2821502 RepID=UPI001B0DE9AA|nr:hypothetical protein [Roseofilum sp. Guam]MBP0027350.1 hypothetical protein [Roseofilum sp. Guam]